MAKKIEKIVGFTLENKKSIIFSISLSKNGEISQETKETLLPNPQPFVKENECTCTCPPLYKHDSTSHPLTSKIYKFTYIELTPKFDPIIIL